ncbi:hypothetical protein BC936DRAFT_146328 [Jimgerdemannia flammicorona]|uniref:Uncharacterized protein n=2 Tax=Jimgerdemannia flammicorona TaxID=994334 RepID=A0A433QZC9_9FUNG|nr:hypothetical protein BC936DRAFT_146328 [Jimgerdemannia flammicorona]RUS35134.1 hypothetical protein BC938DRAFT_475295 [Jimgerdemannia flammicorona]
MTAGVDVSAREKIGVEDKGRRDRAVMMELPCCGLIQFDLHFGVSPMVPTVDADKARVDGVEVDNDYGNSTYKPAKGDEERRKGVEEDAEDTGNEEEAYRLEQFEVIENDDT